MFQYLNELNDINEINELNGQIDIPFGTTKWESEKIFSSLIGDGKKEWILSKNLKRRIKLA